MRIFLIVPVLAALTGPALADHGPKPGFIPGPGAKPCRTIWPPEPSCAGGPSYALPKIPWDKSPFTGSFPSVPSSPNHPGGPLLEHQLEILKRPLGPGFSLPQVR